MGSTLSRTLLGRLQRFLDGAVEIRPLVKGEALFYHRELSRLAGEVSSEALEQRRFGKGLGITK